MIYITIISSLMIINHDAMVEKGIRNGLWHDMTKQFAMDVKWKMIWNHQHFHFTCSLKKIIMYCILLPLFGKGIRRYLLLNIPCTFQCRFLSTSLFVDIHLLWVQIPPICLDKHRRSPDTYIQSYTSAMKPFKSDLQKRGIWND